MCINISKHLWLNYSRTRLNKAETCSRIHCETIFMPRQPVLGQGLLTVEISWSHSYMHHSVGLLWTSNQADAETATYTSRNKHKRHISMHPAKFEPAIPASQRPQTHAFYSAPNGIGTVKRCNAYLLPYVWLVGTTYKIRGLNFNSGN